MAASIGTAAPAPTTTPQFPAAIPTETPAPTNTPNPTATPTIPPAVVEVAGATLASGFSMTRYADMYRPTGLAFDAAGRLYATSFDGTIHVFVDSDGDGRADVDSIFFAGFNIPLGVTVRPNTVDVYVSSFGKISILRDRDGDLVAEEAVNFVRDLPADLHQNDNLKFGPDGWLYMGIGSTCDACVEADARSGTIMRFDPASGAGEVYATGMRNPYDLAFHPLTGDLFATDNGRDDLGLDTPLEELNHIVQGGDYGWPDCWDDLAGIGCAGTRPAIAFFEPRSSANSLDFYTGGHFPAEYQYNLFVAVFGSFLKDVTRGVARVELSPAGDSYTAQISWLARWPGMPLGLITGPDGALYVGDYINGGIYRISYGS
ncbi:MAG: PQQ-dependent sugar dehydrogenase [Chloroflexi bacterium]|nr:PQQ-dependent sugar dehydrogenase [Chloroflexota bacterium]MCI0576484.1 PQQ-dependent sugar dehydrogenase [Chloroflexota bacterium]MCI0649540.1 PQQ-dependent sugar dehydrogenase [Chloroflexota bacterium]MCI0729384.1 PQQ-dependent sugar dehydrogenase [Chloroflexota bacterium]